MNTYVCMRALFWYNEINCKIFGSDLEILLSKIDLSVFHKFFFSKKKKLDSYRMREYRYAQCCEMQRMQKLCGSCTLTNKQTSETRVDVWESIPVDNKQACPCVSYLALANNCGTMGEFLFAASENQRIAFTGFNRRKASRIQLDCFANYTSGY